MWRKLRVVMVYIWGPVGKRVMKMEATTKQAELGEERNPNPA